MTASTHRRTCEDQQTVEAIFHRAHMVLPYPTTELQLTVQGTQREAERNRARQVLAPKGCQHDCTQGRACTCAFGVCDPDCPGWAAMDAPRHPASNTEQAEPYDLLPARVFWLRAVLATVFVGYFFVLVLVLTS